MKIRFKFLNKKYFLEITKQDELDAESVIRQTQKELQEIEFQKPIAVVMAKVSHLCGWLLAEYGHQNPN